MDVTNQANRHQRVLLAMVRDPNQRDRWSIGTHRSCGILIDAETSVARREADPEQDDTTNLSSIASFQRNPLGDGRLAVRRSFGASAERFRCAFHAQGRD
jgi:hypothetical protein